MRLQPVILAGGSGSRLWPLSRQDMPKQFLPLIGERSLLQETAMRLVKDLDGCAAPIVVCNESHRFLVLDQLREAGIEPLRGSAGDGRVATRRLHWPWPRMKPCTPHPTTRRCCSPCPLTRPSRTSKASGRRSWRARTWHSEAAW